MDSDRPTFPSPRQEIIFHALFAQEELIFEHNYLVKATWQFCKARPYSQTKLQTSPNFSYIALFWFDILQQDIIPTNIY